MARKAASSIELTTSSASAPAEDATDGGLRVLSYNVWSLFGFVSQDREERMTMLADRFDKYDIVCLQEQFYDKHFDILFNKGSKNHAALPHRRRFRAADPIGSGLAIASRYPIVASTFIPYKSNGCVERVHEGDFFAMKGVALCRIQVPKSKLYGTRSTRGEEEEETEEIVVANSHLIARYKDPRNVGGYEKEPLACHRLAQMHQLAETVSTSVGRCSSTPVILCGDLNCDPDSPEIMLLKNYCSLRGLELQFAITAPTMTAENPYLSPKTKDHQVDHIFCTKRLWRISHAAVTFKDKVIKRAKDGKMCPLSDHYAIEAVLHRVSDPEPASPVRPRGAEADAARAKLKPIRRFLVSKSESMRSQSRFGYIAFVSFLVLAGVLPYLLNPYYGAHKTFGLILNSFVSALCGFLSVVSLAVGRTRGTEAVAMEVAAEDMENMMISP